MEEIPSFGRRLKRLRVDRDLTQEAFAERVGCAVQTIRTIENGTRRPSQEMAERLVSVLQLATAERAELLQLARAPLQRGVRPPPYAPAALPNEQPPAGSPLPWYATRFVGREHERAEISRLLMEPTCRLITLLGCGGIGKTRLAVELIRHGIEGLPRTHFVPLADLSDASLLPLAIGEAIGFSFGGTGTPGTQVLSYLRSKHLLLVLDNFEQVIGGVALLSDILQHAPSVKLLVTSRERLHLQGEWVLELAGLSVPHDDAVFEQSADAVALFAERARQAQHGFELNAATRATVARICRLVDGMPLGIELAATWIRLLSCEAIAQELERNLDLLQTTVWDMPSRHRSLQAVFEHSWQTLSATERSVLGQLTVFRGGFSREAAVEVAGATLRVLAALIDKSLLRPVEQDRYDLHPLVRQYAHQKLLEAAPEHDAALARHSSFYIRLAHRLKGDLEGSGQLEAIATIRTEFENIRQAWLHAVACGETTLIHLPLKSFWYFFETLCWFQEANELLRGAVDQLEERGWAAVPHSPEQAVVYGYVQAVQGYFAHRLGWTERASQLADTAVRQLRAFDAPAELALALYVQGLMAWLRGDMAAAKPAFEEQLALCSQLGDRWWMALAYGTLGMVAHMGGDYTEAERLMRNAIDRYDALGDQRMMSVGMGFLTPVLLIEHRYAEAEELLRESLAISRRINERWAMMLTLDRLGQVALAQGKAAEAAQLFQDTLVITRESGERWVTAQALTHLGQAQMILGDEPGAEAYFREGLMIAVETNSQPIALDALVGLAALFMRHGRYEQAFVLVTHVLKHPAGSPAAKEQATRLHMDVATMLTPAQIVVGTEQALATSFDAMVGRLIATDRDSFAVLGESGKVERRRS